VDKVLAACLEKADLVPKRNFAQSLRRSQPKIAIFVDDVRRDTELASRDRRYCYEVELFGGGTRCNG
jgi:hypothetical protein